MGEEEWEAAQRGVIPDGTKVAKKKSLHGQLTGLAQEVYDEVQEQMRAKCVAEMLFSKEGRDLLENGAGDNRTRIMEAYAKAAAMIEETESLKRQVEELQEQIDAVGEREEREEHLRAEIA